MKCCFCLSTDIKKLYSCKYHHHKPDHGPFDFYKCLNCGSGLTLPPPDEEALRELYLSFDGGMNKFTRNVRTQNPLSKWYRQCVSQLIKYNGSNYTQHDFFTWLDVGAGNGEVSVIMSELYPNSRGLAIDFHSRPSELKENSNVSWMSADLNLTNFHTLIDNEFDIVFSITVLEHVLHPDSFIQSLLKLINKTGSIYITCPDMSSMASKVLSRYWPYLIFGEHLNIPSKSGLNKLFDRFWEKTAIPEKSLLIGPVTLLYPVTYYLDHFRISFLKSLFSKETTIDLNTGILELAYF